MPLSPREQQISVALHDVEIRLTVERQFLAIQKDTILRVHGSRGVEEWNARRASLTKRLYNLKEQKHVLSLMWNYPERTFYGQTTIVGVAKRDGGRLVHQFGERTLRIADWSESSQRVMQLGDLKSASTTKASVAGGLKKDPEIEAVFRDSASIQQQLAKESAAIQRARGKWLVVDAKDPLTGRTTRHYIRPSRLKTSIVTDYLAIHDRLLPVPAAPRPSVRVGAPPTPAASRTTNQGAVKPKAPRKLPVVRIPGLGPRFKVDVTKLKLHAGRLARFGASLARGMLIGLVTDLLVGFAASKLADWVFSGMDDETLKRLAKGAEPEIQKKMNDALDDHIRRLARQGGTQYGFVVAYRLVYMPRPISGMMLHAMLIDRVVVTEHYWAAGRCRVGDVKKDLADYMAQTLAVRVVICEYGVAFDYPAVAEPSLTGTWTEYYRDNIGTLVSLARFVVVAPPKGVGTPIVRGVYLPTGDDVRITKVDWSGHWLTMTAHIGDTVIEYFLAFAERDRMSGSARVSTKYHVRPDGTRTWDETEIIWRR